MSKTLPIAVQVYSVREEAERDFAGTMKKLGEMGYDGVELAGLYGKSAEEIRDRYQRRTGNWCQCIGERSGNGYCDRR